MLFAEAWRYRPRFPFDVKSENAKKPYHLLASVVRSL